MPYPNFRGNRRWWTRERVLTALQQAIKELHGPLPCADYKWNEVKKGRLDWPPASRVLEYFGAMGRAWLAAGAPRSRVILRNIAWTASEQAYLLEHAGNETLSVIARRLRRSYQSVRARLSKNLKITARANQGLLSAAELSREFHCSYHRIRRALGSGQIKGSFDQVRNRWQIDTVELTPQALAILTAPKLHSYKTTPPDLGDYYRRHGLMRKIIDGKMMVVNIKLVGPKGDSHGDLKSPCQFLEVKR
jgi:hypothetical protein